MTLASEIITRAYRESTLIPLGGTPNTNQVNEALDELNILVKSVVGDEVGDPLTDVLIGGTYDQSNYCDPWVPKDVRLVLNLSGAKTLNLDPNPVNGQRFAVVDIPGNLATYNLTLTGNEHNIEGSSSLVLSTNSLNREWLYRADLGNWIRMSDLLSSSEMPFPEEFDVFFQTSLALRLNPRYGQSLAPETAASLAAYRTMLRSAYNKPKQIPPELVSRKWLVTEGRWYQGYGGSPDFFAQGRPWPWR